MLYLVSTPIGNLEDISLRAMRILSEADIIACEDTRHARILFEKHGIRPKRLISYHSHNERARAQELADELRRGAEIALVTDAGTPGISDPAWAIVQEAILSGIPVSPIPGACAAIAALSASGLDTSRFVFEGFLPLKKGRKRRIESIAKEERTTVIYESPHRIKRLLAEIVEACGAERAIVLGREITKHFETFYRGSASEVTAKLDDDFPDAVKGECVLLISGFDRKTATTAPESGEAAAIDTEE